MREILNGWGIWQNKGFGEIMASSLGAEAILVNNVQVFARKRPFIGYTTADIHTPGLEYSKFLKIRDFCNERRFISLTINSYERIDGLGAYLKDDTRGTYLLDLGLDEKELWHDLGDKSRNMVRKGERNGICIKIATDESELNRWYEIYKDTGISKGFPTEPYQLIKNLFQSEYSKLFCAYKEDVMLSGAFIVHDKKCMTYWLGGFAREYTGYSPNNLLHWEISMYGKKNGYLVYDLGGVFRSSNEGPSAFKKSFGGTFVTSYTYEISFKNLKSRLGRTKVAELGARLFRKLTARK